MTELLTQGMLIRTMFKGTVLLAKGAANALGQSSRELRIEQQALQEADMWLQTKSQSATRDFLCRIDPAQLVSVTSALRSLHGDLDGQEMRAALRETFSTLIAAPHEEPLASEAADLVYEAILRALSKSDSTLRHHADSLLKQWLFQHVGNSLSHRLNQHELELRQLQATLSGTLGGLALRAAGSWEALTNQAPLAIARRAPRTESATAIAANLTAGAWIALYGTHGCGKTQLAMLVAERLQCRASWHSLRDSPSTEVALALLRLASDVTSEHEDREQLIVIDDLPYIEPGSSLETQLLRIARAVRLRGSRLLTLSSFRLTSPAADTATAERQSPEITANEIGEYLAVLGAPESIRQHKTCSFYCALSRGNALLTQSLVQFLEARNWQAGEVTLRVLLEGGHAQKITDQVLRRVIATVCEADARELLYRLALWSGSFGANVIDIAAAVSPAIRSPRECATLLRDIWLEALDQDRYRVAASLKALENNLLAPSTRRATQEAFGDALFLKESITPNEAFYAAAHYLGAGCFGKAGTVLLYALSNINEQDHISTDFDLLTLDLPDDCCDPILLPLTALQLSVAQRMGQSSENFQLRLRRLLANLGTENEWTIISAAGLAAPRLALTAPDIACQLLERAALVSPGARLPNGTRCSLPNGICTEELLLLAVLHIDTDSDASAVLTLLQLLPKSIIDKAQRSNLSQAAITTLTRQVAARELRKPIAERNWQKAREALQQTGATAKQIGWMELAIHAQRAEFLVAAEHCAEAAVAHIRAREALSCCAIPQFQILLAECIVRIHLINNDLAAAEQAVTVLLSHEGNNRDQLVTDVLIDIGLLIPDFRAAEAYFEQALARFSALDKLSRLDEIRVLGELAIVRTGVDDWIGAYEATERAMQTIESIHSSTSTHWKACAVSLWNVSGYVSANVRGLATRIGLTKPTRGAMYCGGDAVESLYSEHRHGTAFWLQADLADAVNKWDEADKWRSKAVNAVDSICKDSQFIVRLSGVAQLLSTGDYEAALTVCERHNSPFTSEEAASTFLLPALALHALHPDQRKFDAILSALHSTKTRIAPGGLFDDAAKLYEMVAERCDAGTLLSFGMSRDPGIVATALIAASVDADVSLDQALTYQLSMFFKCKDIFRQQSSFTARLALPFLVSFWQQSLTRTGFAFRAPELLRQQLGSLHQELPCSRIARVFESVSFSLHARLPAEVSAWINQSLSDAS